MNQLYKYLFVLFTTSLLLACASVKPSHIDDKLMAWQGADIDTVIQTWGLPSHEQKINGVHYAEWNSREISRSPSVNVGIGGFGSRFFGSIGTTLLGGKKETFCKVQVGYNEQGRVILTNWTGDADACDTAIPIRH